MKKRYYLDGLDCPVCAEKVADRVRSLGFVSSAAMNYPQKLLTVDYSEYSAANQAACFGAVRAVEPDVKISEQKTQQQFNPLSILPTAAGLLLFVLSYIPKLPTALFYALVWVGYILIAFKILKKSALRLRTLDFMDENFLMSIASLGAMCISMHLEAVAVLIFYQVGEAFQDLAVGRSRRSISELMDIRPDTARIVDGDGERIVAPEQVEPGDVISVLPGEKIPLDGEVLQGTGTVDSSALTGESVPREFSVGDELLSGCINLNSAVTIRVTRPFAESTVSKILDLVENSSAKKSRSESFITRFARVYTPAVVAAAALLFVIGAIITGQPTDWLYRALTFLVVSCPCALVLSVPLCYFSAVGRCAKGGVLVKGGSYLERLREISAVFFDKTGTLTTGSFTIASLHPAHGVTEQQLLLYAAAAESRSTHPIARSIVSAAPEAIDTERLSDYTEKSAFGVTAVYDNHLLAAGSEKLMRELGVSIEKQQGAVVYVVADGSYAGAICLSDEIKPGAETAIARLRAQGIASIAMLTGDNESAAKSVADRLGIDYHAGLLPDGKVELVERQKGKAPTAFVGDGINDAPVLSGADVGVAMGGVGSDSAIEAADFVIMNDDIGRLADAIDISRYTRKIVVQNIVFALGIKLVILLLSAMGLCNMWAAVFADVGVSLLAVLNAMRILRHKIKCFTVR